VSLLQSCVARNSGLLKAWRILLGDWTIMLTPEIKSSEPAVGPIDESCTKIRSDRAASLCADCPIRHFNICGVLLGKPLPEDDSRRPKPIWQVQKKVPARRNIKNAGEHADRVSIICDGWAFRFVQLPDGRRQILSILIPGDVVTTTRLFDDSVRFSVQALTDVRFCGYARSTLRTQLIADAELLDAWASLFVVERHEHFGLLIDLGSRSADERIAHLILDLTNRLEQRGIVVGPLFIFPLPQKLVAAVTGLTTEHVNRVFGSFRKMGLIETGKGYLKVIDLAGLQGIGGLHC
jgi:CRP/FNR family transcriptional regulator, anaerobic regulatory protein